MEENAIEDPEIRLTPQTWLETFGINNSIDTPIGKVRMGENQYAKLQDKKRTSEFGMISLTLSDPDVIFVEPSKAKGEDVAERNYSYVFAKTFKRNGNKVKYYTSVTVSIDGLEISVSSHFVNPNKMLNKLMEFNREYTKETLFSNSSEMRLAEHQSDVPDLLPTQENNVSSTDKVTQSSQTKQEKEDKFVAAPRKEGESILGFAERLAAEHQSYQERKEEEAKVDTNPTDAQKEAGNYKKGHIKVDGLNITIEQPKGSIRRGTDANGKQWESEMHNTYGYIRGTESVDGDHIDIFLSDNPTEGNVFVVDQVNKDGSFDEHKVMYGFSDMESAKRAYLSNYEEGWQGLGNITEVSKEDFKKWIDSSKRKTKPFAEYTSVKTQGDVQAKKPTEIPHLTEKEKREQRKQELRNKIKVKLRGQLNVGVDPELFMMGVELASMEIEDGVRKFADFTKKMIAEIGDEIRPYLKSIYNGARDLPGMEELSEEMTPYEEVKAFNIATIGDKGEEVKPSVFDTAEQINNEQTVERSAKEEVKNTVETQDVDSEAYSITKQHNNKKDIDIWVVRGKERTDSDAFKERKQVAKKHNGYYSSFRGVNGFVFNTPEDAQSFADAIFNTQSEENRAQNSEEDIISKEKTTDHKEVDNDKDETANDIPTSNGLEGRFTSAEDIEGIFGKTFVNNETGTEIKVGHFISPYKVAIKINGQASIEEWRHLAKALNKEGWQEKIVPDLHGLKIGDKVLYKEKEATIFDFDNGRPVLDTGLAPVVYEVVDMDAVKPIEKQEQTKTNVKEDLTEEKTEAKAKEANNKTVSSHAEGNLFDTVVPTESLTNKEKENEVHLSNGETATKRERGHEPRQNEPMGESKQNEAQRPDGRRMDRRDTAHISTDTERGGGVPNVSEGKQRLNSNNNHGERGVDYAPTSIDARIEANIQAIELAKKLTENGEKATPQQMEILRKFSGWGGLGKAFNENPNGAYGEINKTPRILKELLGEEAYNNAIESANSSYYTPTHIIDTLWDIAEKLGFKGGRILEGSAGIGNIIAQIPTHISENSNIHAVEKDPTAGSILSLLYPDAKVDIQGFEETSIPNGSIDLAITNVPFVTGLRVWDTTSDKDLSKKFHDIHNFCIAKNIRKLREGGIGIFISSNGTLDNSQQIRNWVVNDGNADFIGAFRLNNKTFLGTSVTSDIIVVRKRVNGKKSAKAIDVSEVSGERIAEFNTGEVKKVKGKMIPVIKDLPMDYNKYFIEHPEKMAGVMEFAFEHGDTYRPTTKQLYPTKDKPQDKLLEEFVNSFSIDTEEQAQNIDNEQGINNSIYEELGSDVKEGSMVVSNGELCVAQYGQAVPLKLNANKVKGRTKQECFKSYTDIKQALNDVLAYETQNADDKGLQPLLDKLNKAYDDFVNTYGHLNKNTSISFLRNDIDFSNILALETYKEENDENNNRVKVYGKTDVFSKRVVTKETEPKPDNVKDGVIVSIYKNGRIDIPYISKQLNMSEDAVKNEIINSGLGFENPVSKEIEVSYKYLSGNVREKLQQAEENNENGEYSNNINALKKVIPANIPAHLIEFNLGSSWVTPKLYEEYIKNKTGLDVTLIPVDGTWVMKAPLYGLAIEQNRSMGVYSKLKGETILGHELIEAAIQNKTITISKTRKDWDGKKETIVDKDATQACNSRIDEIRQDFKDWARGKVQSDVELSQELEKIYNDKFNNYVAPTIPEEFIPERFGGAAQNIKLRPHQAQAVVRGTTQPLILAHEVGTGKTFTLISTAMEMRRLGTARKPMIVVQNATVGQFVASAKALYPNAKILTLENSDRGEDGRRRFYAKIRYNDWDMIVVPQSTFEFIPDSKDRQITFIKDKVDEKLAVLQRMKEANNEGDDFITRRVEKEISQLQSEIAALIENNESEQREKKATASELKKKEVAKKNTEAKAKEMLDRRTDDVEDFDELGIDALLVDEAHEYKHLGFATAMQRGVKGVDPSYSKKAQSVFLKTQAVLSKNNGRNVIFATGTPISNTAAEIWTFMRYLMPADTMKEYGIYYFDDFVRNFGNIQQMLEFTTSGKFKENNRFAGYINLPELARIWSSVADIVLTRDQKKLKEKIPEIEGGKAQDIYLPQTKSLRSVMKYVKDQLTIFENMSGAEKKENTHIPLTMYGIAKAAAVDARLVDATAEDDVNSKTNEAVRQTLQSLKDTNGYKGTVAIFADVYQNKAFGFNLYEDIKKKLIEKGVPEKEIFVMKPGMTINKKLEIFNKVNSGEIRVILGSTFTLGTGVNIQERLHTLIHLDAPNRPMDYTQRNGRILRQGNIHKEMNKPVRILRFGVEDSLDVTAYQRLKTKGAIADSIMNSKQLIENSMENRELEEEADLFGDTVAQLSGSEYAMLKNQAEKEVRKYESKKRQWEADQTYIHNAKPRLKGQISKAEQLLEDNNASLKAVKETFPNGKFNQITIGKQQFDSIEAMTDFIKDYNKKINEESNKLKEKANANYNSQMVVNIDGLEFTIHLELAKETANKGVSLFSKVTRKMYYSQNELGLKNVPIKQGLLRNGIEDILNNVITGHDFAERIDTLKQSIAQYKSDLELILARDGKPFEFKNELETAKQKLEEYTEAMKEELEEKEKKYAAMDSEIKTATNIIGAEEAEDEDSTESKDTKDDILYRTVFGGNSGYVGYSMSKRAVEAKEEGRYPKTEFRREYHITAKSLDMLTSLGFIDNSEWHHTSMYGNKTPFYGWAEDELADDYLKHKKEIDTLCKGIDPKTKQPLIEKVEKPQYEYKFELPQYNEAATAANPIIEWRHKQIEKYDQFTGFKGYAYETKEKKKERDAFLHSLNEQMEEKIREMLAKDFPDYLAAKNAIEAYNNYDENLRKAIGERIKEYLDIDKYSQRWREQTATTQPTANVEELTNHAESVVQNLHLNNVEIVPDGSNLNGEQATAKGFYDKRTGKIVVVVSNHTDIADIEKTVLHEAVAHHGLRELFGDNFDNFLDTVFAKADIETRRQIAHLSAKHGWNIRTATEEYLAGMAEDANFEQLKPTTWQRIKRLFGEMMSALGLHHSDVTDNDLRYLLWRSYKNLENGGKRSILDMAEDIAMQYRLKVGNYTDKFTDELNAVNERFNEKLSNLTEENADKVALNLGTPSAILRAAGVENKPMKLYGNKVIKKIKKHGFALEELKDLPKAVANPIAVFNNYKKEGNRSILTELKTKQGNFLVTIDLGKGTEDIDFNIVSSVFGKDSGNIVDWIERGLAVYINKEKALNYLHHSALRAEALSSSRLNSAAKIIKDFHNPKLNSNVLYRSSIDPTATEVLPDARTRYEEETKEPDNIGSVPKTHNFFRRFYKSYIDSMLALKSFTNSVLEATGDKMASHEDTYKAENAMTSKNKTDGEVYNPLFPYMPLYIYM
ncbi:helicase-related protein [Prevotella pallens]|uniref:MuF-C-terminal domain-containing protein n=1 Tax=Prevotella pallens TaxID=60133 RepID=UPI0024935EFB|nr:helicase-related protein [Prevotella pallens]